MILTITLIASLALAQETPPSESGWHTYDVPPITEEAHRETTRLGEGVLTEQPEVQTIERLHGEIEEMVAHTISDEAACKEEVSGLEKKITAIHAVTQKFLAAEGQQIQPSTPIQTTPHTAVEVDCQERLEVLRTHWARIQDVLRELRQDIHQARQTSGRADDTIARLAEIFHADLYIEEKGWLIEPLYGKTVALTNHTSEATPPKGVIAWQPHNSEGTIKLDPKEWRLPTKDETPLVTHACWSTGMVEVGYPPMSCHSFWTSSGDCMKINWKAGEDKKPTVAAEPSQWCGLALVYDPPKPEPAKKE